MKAQIEETVTFLRSKFGDPPNTAVILGSGLGIVVKNLADSQSVPYQDIPHLPVSKVSGHAGKLTVGDLGGVRTAFLEGRSHFYEGYPMKQIGYPVYVLKNWGIKTLVVTNAAGGINRNFSPGDMMLITDHINLMGSNPLIGDDTDDALGSRFVDMSEPYSRRLLEVARTSAQELKIPYREGVYVGWPGPTYETAAEIRFMATIGADAVGMSTVPEIIAAVHAGLEVLAISCITNMATGISSVPHSHTEVVATAQRTADQFYRWLKAMVSGLN